MLPPAMRHAWIAFALVACSSSEALPPPDVALSVGKEQTAWTKDPPAARLRVELVPMAGSPTQLKEVPAPPAAAVNDTTPPTIVSIDEQHFAKSIIASFRATGIAENGDVVLRGDSIFYGMSSIYAVRIPIFMGRVQSWARPVSPLRVEHLRPVVTTIYELLVTAGGEPVTGQDPAVPEFFDVAVWQTVTSQPPLPRAPKSMAPLGTKVLSLNETGATLLDLSTDDSPQELSVTTPPLDYALLAGGDTVIQPDGPRYIIGGTRQDGAPSDQVLRLDLVPVKNDAGKIIDWKVVPTALKLSAPRLGAAATFVGTTLVVVGGSATAPMVEVLPKDATSFTQLPYPPDATAGLGVAPLDDKNVIVVGGQDPGAAMPGGMRTIDITCAASCTATDAGAILDAAQMPVKLARTKVFALEPTKMLVAGETDSATMTGVNEAFLIDPSQTPIVPKPVALQEPRARATPALLPNGQIAMVGGQLVDGSAGAAKTIEIFIP
jgi:hypothetical protein